VQVDGSQSPESQANRVVAGKHLTLAITNLGKTNGHHTRHQKLHTEMHRLMKKVDEGIDLLAIKIKKKSTKWI
jgi:hypothetical protein